MTRPSLILLALDESPFLHLGTRALQSAGYDTAAAQDRESLSRILQEATPALLLIGQTLAGQSGMKLAAEQLERFPSLPVVLYVEQDSLEIAKEVLSAGLSGYIFPPLTTSEIVTVVRRSLERARRLGDWVRGEVKRTTASLQRQVVEFDAIFNNIADGVVILDKRSRVMLVNDTAARTFGVSQEAVFGQPVEQAVRHPDLQSMLERSAEDGLKYHEINFDDGRVFNAQYTPLPRIGSAVTMQDISYLKEITRLKNDFIHTVSHDLRSPLTAILGYMELIERVGALNESQRDFLGRLNASVQHMTGLVNELLDLSRLESGFDTRREHVDIRNVVEYSLTVLDNQIRRRNIRLTREFSDDLEPLRANPIRIRQMVDNLIGNAVKYTPPGGSVRVSASMQEDQVILRVSDTGPGIPPEEQSRVFEKFFRASNRPEDAEGSGLGLAIVKSIVESHQGRVWVESKIGAGSTFIVLLPAHE